MKLHIGSGSVFLDGYVNVDVPCANTFLASERPDLVERWLTTDDRYYARHSDKSVETLRNGPLNQEYVCDRYGSFAFLPVLDGEVDSALSVQSFEHLSLGEAHQALDILRLKLKDSGTLRLDVPDHNETMRLLLETKDPFFVRHLMGPRRGAHGVHMQSYSVDGLKSLVEMHGFEFCAQEENIHLYPAMCLRFEKR